MKVVNTTYGWNMGDDLIREGVFRLVGIDPLVTPLYYLNRCQAVNREPLFHVQFNVRPGIMATADEFIVAGTPEWYEKAEGVYKWCDEHEIPTTIVGVGSPAIDNKGVELLKRMQGRGLIRGVTVRDEITLDRLVSSGIRAKLFLDPAFHISIPIAKKDLDIVLCYRASGVCAEYGELYDDVWVDIYNHFKDRIDVVTTHEQPEYIRATNLFPGAKIFFSSEWEAYKSIYCRTAHYIGGRIHGAVPVVAAGGMSCVLYDEPKVATLVCASQVLPAGCLHVLSYKQASEIFSLEFQYADKSTSELVELLSKDFESHRKFLHIGEGQ